MRKPAPATALAALAVACALAACGSGARQTSSAPVSVPTASRSSPATPPPSPTTRAATQERPAPSLQCTAAKLRLSYLGQQGATGHGVLGFALSNTSAAGCRTFGYPGVLFLSRSGRPLPTAATRTTRDFGGSSRLAPLSLAPGASASFRMVVTHFGPAGSLRGCATAYGLQVIPPNDTAALRVVIPGGAYECATATVSPLQPGRAAYP